ncbi:MAG: glycosyltransferase family 2 protein [Patescibacteria group bacterium]|nr:glycosyltransferase family 2 protein [Patescibacteria group bacterium]MDD5121338.1 glycosyltransferase family 2 protein [Patescibacteria group bacterium]MDD5395743.1 glycosyltransferase family 2 protein [Patescibacteria group bacterium]
MKLSIIIVNYNSWKFLDQCLNSLIKFISRIETEVIIVDNNSQESALFGYQEKYPFINLILLKQNLGFAAANNMAAKQAKGDVLFFLNPDTIFIEDIFEKISECFKNNKEVGVISPQLILDNGQLQPYSFGRDKMIDKIYRGNQTQLIKKNNYLFTDWVSGAALAIRRKIFEQINGFDENFFMYFEDRDLCRRVKNLGYKIIVLITTKIIHLGGQSLTSDKKRKTLYYQSQNYYWQKHYGAIRSNLLKVIRFIYLLCS